LLVVGCREEKSEQCDSTKENGEGEILRRSFLQGAIQRTIAAFGKAVR